MQRWNVWIGGNGDEAILNPNDHHECRRWRTYRRKVDCIAAYYNHERACLGCEDGKTLANELNLCVPPTEQVSDHFNSVCPTARGAGEYVGRPAQPRGVHTPKPKPPIRVPVPIWEKPLCKECGRWAAVVHGRCRQCDRKHKKG